MEITTLGAGCFWCIEAVLQRLKGVEKIASGYAGGRVPGRPTYREICSGLTGHAEVVQVTFDPTVINYKDLITVFMTSHDPTQLNRQGADIGTQYRSVVFYHSEKQMNDTIELFTELKNTFPRPIVTEISPIPEFFEAESDHQDFYNSNPEMGYCRVVIDPKIAKLRMQHAEKLK
jgi:peptide-methionine (S)-S-oxide reductase